jgi:hypothetical protein
VRIGVRGLDIHGASELRHHICRFLDREIPDRNGNHFIESHRGSGF